MFKRKYFTLTDLMPTGYTGTEANYLATLLDGQSPSAEAVKLADALALKNHYKYILYVDFLPYQNIEPTAADVVRDFDEWAHKIKYMFTASKDKYKILLSSYDLKKGNLLDKVKGRTTTKYNDTPQDSSSGLDADRFASTYTISESEADFEAIDRLAKLAALYKDVLADWVKVFDGLFIEV